MQTLNCIGLVLLISILVKNVKAITNAEKVAITSTLAPVGFQCIKEYPLTRSQVKVFKNKMFPNGNNPKCLVACVLKKIEVIDDMGMLSPTGIRKYAERVFKGAEDLKNVDDITQHCATVNDESTNDGARGCDRARLAYMCFLENASKYGFDIGDEGNKDAGAQ